MAGEKTNVTSRFEVKADAPPPARDAAAAIEISA